MKDSTIGATRYARCPSCNALWFASADAGFLTYVEAERLASESIILHFNKPHYRCPVDSSKLNKTQFRYECPHCGGCLTNGHLLAMEKKNKVERAQALFPIPNAAWKSVVIGLGVISIVVLNVVMTRMLQRRTTLATEAASITHNFEYSHDGSATRIYFATQMPYRSSLIIAYNGSIEAIPINTNPKEFHSVLVPSLNPHAQVMIELTDEKGTSTRTAPLTLTLEE